jgi:hypothetical protein
LFSRTSASFSFDIKGWIASGWPWSIPVMSLHWTPVTPQEWPNMRPLTCNSIKYIADHTAYHDFSDTQWLAFKSQHIRISKGAYYMPELNYSLPIHSISCGKTQKTATMSQYTKQYMFLFHSCFMLQTMTLTPPPPKVGRGNVRLFAKRTLNARLKYLESPQTNHFCIHLLDCQLFENIILILHKWSS